MNVRMYQTRAILADARLVHPDSRGDARRAARSVKIAAAGTRCVRATLPAALRDDVRPVGVP
ncbi:hypothetical protein WS62_17345 [Burkholderia sp. ABCPW 14]|nr:hypothetical protein WS62_17345 [Burkholderia sp. ABCPW 14]